MPLLLALDFALELESFALLSVSFSFQIKITLSSLPETKTELCRPAHATDETPANVVILHGSGAR